jgi:Domain of unknown function (DUF1854)
MSHAGNGRELAMRDSQDGGALNAEPSPASPAGDLRFLDPRLVRAWRNEWGKLVVCFTHDGSQETVEGVRPVRSFPLTAPDRQIVLLEGEERELGIIRDLRALDRTSREAIGAELEIAYLVTRVQAIRSVRSRFGVTTWELETDRGSRTAHVKERSDIRPLSGGRIMLTDVDGVKYEIPPPEELDERSRSWLVIEG